MEELNEKLNKILTYGLLSAKSMLTLEDACLLTGLSRSHLYRLTCEKRIPYYKPGGKFLYFDRKELESWMRRNRQSTLEESEQSAIAYIVGSRKEVRDESR